ncbi:MAG: hemerythrin domain-containing protein [Sneathiella sp.]|nr:hemerythrin domain-containing protein [Sneathiella sp.]
MSRVIAKLEEDHRRMAVLLRLLDREIENFSKGQALDFFLIETVLDYMLNFPDLCHHPIEDIIREQLDHLDAGAAKATRDLCRDHEKLSAMTRRFAAAVQAVQNEQTLPREHLIKLAEEYRDFLLQHMKYEETEFFPAAQKLLSPQDWEMIEKRLGDKADKLFGREADREYRALHKVIVEWGDKQPVKN